jgi:hypothetical protein
MGRLYPRILATIVLAYALVIIAGGFVQSGPGRLLVLGYLLAEALRLRHQGATWPRRVVWPGTVVVVGGAAWAVAVAPATVASGLVGGLSFVLTAAVILVVGSTIVRRRTLDTPTVIGVLSVYLLLALLFASLNQLLAAFHPNGYLTGVSGLPSASDQLYFSVITMTTVGYGDIVPGTPLARAVVVVEALTGQLYLVSVVAAVVGGWKRQS